MRGFALLGILSALTLACLAGAGCTGSSQQQPKQTAASTFDGYPSQNAAPPVRPATADSDPADPPASITRRGAAIEADLDNKFNTATPAN